MSLFVLTCLGIPSTGRADEPPQFGRHVVPLFSKLGCNGGTCHGAVKGKNGFRLSLFGADPQADYAQLVFGAAGRRVNAVEPEQSLFLLKATQSVPHEGGRRVEEGSADYQLLRQWVASRTRVDDAKHYRVTRLEVTPDEEVVQPGSTYQLKVVATFEDGASEDVTHLCSFESRDKSVVTVSKTGLVAAVGVGDAALIVRYRDEPRAVTALVPRPTDGSAAFPDVQASNFIDEFVLAKLRRLNIPPSALTDDATFLRRASLDVAGELPTPDEVRAFLKDTDPAKRAKKIDELLARPGHAAVWTMKFCDLLKATDFGVYADGMRNEDDAPRFAAWVRARLAENTPYNEFAARILLATSRDGKSIEDWAKDVEKLYELSTSDWGEHAFYTKRQTLDLYWQRKDANGVPGTLQIAHAFLGLRLECAQCHRHPHDVWQQDDLLSFANFFMHVRRPGFQGENEKNYPDHAVVFKRYEEEGKKLEEESKKLKEGRLKELANKLREAEQARNKARGEINRLTEESKRAAQSAKAKREEADKLAADKAADAERLRGEAAKLDDEVKQNEAKIAEQEAIVAAYDKAKAEHDEVNEQAKEMERRGKNLKDSVAKRVLHTDIFDQPHKGVYAQVTSPLGTQQSEAFRLLGAAESIQVKDDEDPRKYVVDWLRRPDNPYFARAMVNRVWAHYFGRGIIDPPDNLSPLNPPTHPKLLDALCKQFIEHHYDLRWLHRTILTSRTYQQGGATAGNEIDRANYAYFYYRRLPAEVLVDALDRATGTREKMDMTYWRWPENVRAIEAPMTPQNGFVTFMFEQFGKPKRNAAVQCDCERDMNPSVLQVMSLANHPRVLAKIADGNGAAATIAKSISDNDTRIDEMFLTALGRFPSDSERTASRQYLADAGSADKGLQGILWSLLNTREFTLQH